MHCQRARGGEREGRREGVTRLVGGGRKGGREGGRAYLEDLRCEEVASHGQCG